LLHGRKHCAAIFRLLSQLSDVLFGKQLRGNQRQLWRRLGRTVCRMHFQLLVTVPRYDTVLAAKFHFGEFILGK
jgi:hypothetical protein